MLINLELLKRRRACIKGINSFLREFPSGEADSSQIFARMIEIGDTEHRVWLQGVVLLEESWAVHKAFVNKYPEGSVVQVRQWDDMEKQFLAYDTGIEGPGCTFAEPMKDYCGTKVTVTEWDTEDFTFQAGGWWFSPYMFEEVKTLDTIPEELVSPEGNTEG